jgi:ATP-dependent Clp protease, protease subunit
MDLKKDFYNFAVKDQGISSATLYGYEKASLTPYITEETDRRAIQMDIFSRMLIDRVLWLAGEVNDNMSTIAQAQLLWLDREGNTDITVYIDSQGGSVKSGLSIVDVINYISCDVTTINTGMAASMGSILLGCGTKGKRGSLPNSRVMLHQVSGGVSGPIQEMAIALEEAKKYNDKLFRMLGEYCGKDPEQVKLDADRDKWMDADEALDYGIIDFIITKKK